MEAAARLGATQLRIICPFIKLDALGSLLAHNESVQVITRFNLDDFASGVSDLQALRRLVTAGAQVRGVRGLHAKVYIFRDRRAIVTSANLTRAGLDRNHEFGLVSEDRAVLEACERYFQDLWPRAGKDLTASMIDNWELSVTQYLVGGARAGVPSGLADHGANANLESALPIPVGSPQVAPQAFVKFLGEGRNRVPVSYPVFDEIKSAGCHWALGYPAEKRPRKVRDGAVMFIARLTHSPNDMRVFGRAVGLQYVPGRDDATPFDIAERTWKQEWPRYVRVHHAEFVAGDLKNGVSLDEMMSALGANAFAPTQRNARQRVGNTDPRRAYLRQAGVELSNDGYAWLNERLEAAFQVHGNIPADDLARLDWPEVPVPGGNL